MELCNDKDHQDALNIRERYVIFNFQDFNNDCIFHYSEAMPICRVNLAYCRVKSSCLLPKKELLFRSYKDVGSLEQESHRKKGACFFQWPTDRITDNRLRCQRYSTRIAAKDKYILQTKKHIISLLCTTNWSGCQERATSCRHQAGKTVLVNRVNQY